MTFTLVHSSQRFDLPAKRVLAHAAAIRAIPGVVAVTRTEMGGKNYEQLLAHHSVVGWGSYQAAVTAARGADECATEWREHRLILAGTPKAVKLSDMTYTRAPEYGGGETPPVHALVIPLAFRRHPRRHLNLIAVHMPVDNTGHRRDVWIDCAKGLVNLRKDLGRVDPEARAVIAADLNANVRNDFDRALVREHICIPAGMEQAWVVAGVPDQGGTHGKHEIIDGHIVDVEGLDVVGCELLPDPSPDDSDHRAFGTELAWVGR